MTGTSVTSWVKRIVTTALLAVSLAGCVLVAQRDVPPIRAALGAPSWPVPEGYYVSDQGNRALVRQTVSPSGLRIYSISENGDDARPYALYRRPAPSWYVLESVQRDESHFVFAQVLDRTTISLFNDLDCAEPIEVDNVVDLLDALSALYARCSQRPETYRLSQ